MQRDLVERAAAGDREAFEGLVLLSANRLFAIAYRILRDHHLAEDAVQQALVTIWDELPRLRDPERFEAWSYRLIARASIAAARREHADPEAGRSSGCSPTTPTRPGRPTTSARSPTATRSSAGSASSSRSSARS